jgi:integrase
MGHVRKEGSTWYYETTVGKDENGKRKREKVRGFKTKKEAEAALRKREYEISRGSYVEPSKMLYKEVLEDWLNDKKHSVKEQTLEGYKLMADLHIIPALGSTPVQKITAQTLQKFVTNLIDKGKSPSYVKKILAVISGSLKRAERWELIPKNPSALIDKPRISKKELTVWDKHEVEQFLKVAKNDRLYIAFLLAIMTGMRQGEILGLRWKDIDFENGVISIQQTLSHDGKKFLTEAKTKSSIRSVILPKDVLKALRKHRALIQQEKLFAEKYTDLDLVVCTSNGTQVNPSNLRRTFIRLQGQAGVTQIRFHDLRHTHATLLMQLGTNPKVVAERLGHSTTRMTLDTYTHYLPTMQEEAVEKLNTLFSDKAVV